MGLTRKMLEAMGIENDKIESIIEAHSETVTALKAEREHYKEVAESVDTSEDWKSKYEKEHSDFESFKDKQQKKDIRSAKESALADVYRAAGIAEKYIPALLRIADYDTVELDKNGKAKDRDRLIDEAKQENADFNGAKPATPPNSGTKPTMTKDQIMQIKDTAERQKAIAENLSLFGA